MPSGLGLNVPAGDFNRSLALNSAQADTLKAGNVKEAEKTAWQKAFTAYNTQTNTGLDSQKIMRNREKSQNLQSDMKVYQAALQNGANWGTVWNNMHKKYPELTNDVLDGLLQKGKYYVDGKWVSPTSQFPKVVQAVTPAPQTVVNNKTPGATSAVNGPGTGKPQIGASTAQTMSEYTPTDSGVSSGAPAGPAAGPEAGISNAPVDAYSWMKDMYDKGIGADATASLAMQDKQMVANLLVDQSTHCQTVCCLATSNRI